MLWLWLVKQLFLKISLINIIFSLQCVFGARKDGNVVEECGVSVYAHFQAGTAADKSQECSVYCCQCCMLGPEEATSAIVVVDKSKGVLDVAKVALILAQGVLNTAKLAFNAANAALEGVKVLYKVGATALTALVDFSFTKPINIREIYFRRALSVANSFEFDCRVKGVLLGANLDIRVKFNVRDVLSLIGVIADRAISGLSKFIG